MKKLLVVAVIVLVLLVVGGFVLVLSLGRLVKTGVEKGGTMVLGVPVSLKDASASLSGDLGLEGLKLGSPDGFSASEMFKLENMDVSADLWSLASSTVVVHEIAINAPDLTLELSGAKTNWGVLMQRLKKEPDPDEKAGKKMKIGRIVVKNGSVRIAGLPVGGQPTVALPTVEVNDISSGGEDGMPVRDAVRVVVAVIYRAALEAAEGKIPAGRLEDIREGLGSLLKGAGGPLERLKEGAGGAAGEALERATGILGGGSGEDEEQ